jgi:hypothetical protein
MPRSETDVVMVESELVRQMRSLPDQGWGAKRIARDLGVARNTARRYLRGGCEAEVESRPGAWKLDAQEASRVSARRSDRTRAPTQREAARR